MTAPRILYAGLFHETHALLDATTPPEAFTVLRGEAILAKAGDDSPTDGFLSVAHESGWKVQPTLHAHAMPGGPAPDEFFED
jgi:microcystin degradation protein MlrC